MNIDTMYTEVPLRTVLQYYADGFEMKSGREIFQRDFFIDTAKGVVVFKIATREKEAA
jgi:hypothetical protein